MRELFGKFSFVVVYLDDIYVFFNNLVEHVTHLRAVFRVLRENELYARVNKCDFGQTSVDSLGHTISTQGLHVDSRKTRAITEWPEPKNIKDIQRFLG
ncbi:putative reverse transcriptase domain-containing protein [Plasmopara halstedii]